MVKTIFLLYIITKNKKISQSTQIQENKIFEIPIKRWYN